MAIYGKREAILKIVNEKRNLDRETRNMNLVELRQVHQILFEEAVRVGREKLGNNFDINILKKKKDNAFEHTTRNMCPNPVGFCNRKNCDNYDPDCVARKIKDQMNRLASEILRPSSIGPWIHSRATW